MSARTSFGESLSNAIPMKWMRGSKGSVPGAVLALLTILSLTFWTADAWAQVPKAERPTYTVGD